MKMTPTPLVLTLLLLAGCAHAPEETSEAGAEPVVVPQTSGKAVRIRASVESFRAERAAVEDVVLSVPLDPSMGGPGRCLEPLLFLGETRLGVEWRNAEDEAIRLVTAFFDAQGQVRSYNDVRGGATNARSAEPGTAILIDLARDQAIVRNVGPGSPTAYILPLDDALDAPALDAPREWIAEIRERCGGRGAGAAALKSL